MAMSLTYDGSSLNISTIKNLGCEFTDDFNSIKTSLTHPTGNYQVYATLDACHLFKLARNAPGVIKVFQFSQQFYC